MARILVAAADADVRTAIRKALELEGHEILEAGSTAEIRLQVSQPKVHLILIEGDFPDGSGRALCAGLRESGLCAPIIIVSACNQGERRAALDAGADDYITKPFGLRDLLKTVRKHLTKVP